MKDAGGFANQLLAAIQDPRSRMLVASLLAQYAGRVIYINAQPKAPRRAQAAANMLAQGMLDSSVKRELQRVHRVCERTAARDLAAAKRLRQMS